MNISWKSMRTTVIGVLVILLSIALAGCENALVEAAKTIQAETVTPIISLIKADNSILASGATIDFDQISAGSSCDTIITINNDGKSTLIIDIANIKLEMGSTTEANSFTLSALPTSPIEIDASSTFSLRFSPVSGGLKTATVTIQTNDYVNPSFSFSASGTGWPVTLTTNVETGSISTTTATGGGNITDDGGVPVTVRGICWSTFPNPTTADNKIINGGIGLGSYTDLMTGLSTGTLYYVRAFASNGVATGYGSQVSFTTLPSTPMAPATATVRSPTGSGQLAVSWVAVNGSSIYYDVYCSTSNSKPGIAYSSFHDLPTTSCTLTGLNNYNNYYVWIVAKNATGSSTPSASSTPAMVGVPLTSITLSKSSVILWPGYSDTVTFTYEPIDATMPSVTWGTDHPEFVTVSSGTATGVGGEIANPTGVHGMATITASPADGQGATVQTFTATNTLFGTNTPGPAGGKLFYDKGNYSDGWRYMEAALTNVGAGYPWCNSSQDIPGAKGQAIGTGKSNTAAIIAVYGTGLYMARICTEYSLNGYNDWFMPCKDEATQLIIAIPSILSGLEPTWGLFESSSQLESSGSYMYAYKLDTGLMSTGSSEIYTASNVVTRPIRQF